MEPNTMETLREAMRRLRREGFGADFRAGDDASLVCGHCGRSTGAATASVEHVVRFEGTTDPGDESVLFAIDGACGHRGVYSTAYGPGMEPDDLAVVTALPGRAGQGAER